MIVGERLAEIRERKGMSQGVIEARTGLLRCYVSRVENGHTVPSVETLEKFARALEIPLYQLFYEGEVPSEFKKRIGVAERSVPSEDNPEMEKLAKLLPHMTARGHKLLLLLGKAMSRDSGKQHEKSRNGRKRA